MSIYSEESLTFQVPSGVLHCTLITSPEASKELALVLPGGNYSVSQPLLHYAVQVLLQKKFTVLCVDKLYAKDAAWLAIDSREKRLEYIEKDSVELFTQISQRFSHGVHTVVARSIGTYSVACALERKLVNPTQIVWQTPALEPDGSIMKGCAIRGFGIIGTADPFYKNAIHHLPEDRIVVEGADHSMEIDDDPIRSIQILQEVTLSMSQWLQDPVLNNVNVTSTEKF